MPSEVRHLVEHGQLYPLVRLSGVLDGATGGPVRSVLLGLLAAQPEALVVDVGGLRLATVDAAEVLRAVQAETRDWPGTRLVLCGAPDPAVWRPAGWPVCPQAPDAFAALGPVPPADHRIATELEPVAGAARIARKTIVETCGRWGRPEVADSANIVATEMVNNVVVHARTSMQLLLARRDGEIGVAVRDFSASRPRFGGPVAPVRYGGRGLLLIDAVAARWGHLPLDDGKIVWAWVTGDPVPA